MCRSIGARARAFESVGLKCVLLEKTERKECLDRGTFFLVVGCFFARIFFSFPSKSKKRYKKKYDSERPQNFREQNSDVSLSLLSPSLLIQSCAESYCRSIRPVKTWTF